MKQIFLQIIILFILSNCKQINTKKVYLLSDCILVKEFELYNPKICSFRLIFEKTTNLSQVPNNNSVLNVIRINDSIVNIKSFIIKNNKPEITGNMGNFNLNQHLQHKNMNNFIFLCYQKAFGICN